MPFRPILLALAAFGIALPLTAQYASAPVAVEEAYTGPTVYAVDVVARFPHDSDAFTQGLLWHDGALIESTGRVGQSRVRRVALDNGQVLIDRLIPSDQFGEGIALWGDEFISLTWLDRVVHRWQADDLAPVTSIDEFPYEGWGLTTSPEGLIHSDGSATLRILDPQTLEVRRSVEVTLRDRPLRRLNELELIDGLVYANVFETPWIVAIDPADGKVRKLIDLRPLVREVGATRNGAVLNGIAWDASERRLFVTGKLWPTLFEIRLVETDGQVK